MPTGETHSNHSLLLCNDMVLFFCIINSLILCTYHQETSSSTSVCTNIILIAAAAAAAAAKSLQSCPTLCDPIDSSPPGSPIPGIHSEWVPLVCVLSPFSNSRE